MPPNPDTRFLTILRATMDEIEGILPLIQDNIYLRLVNNLQSLYDIHTNYTTVSSTNVDDTISEPYEANTIGEPYDGITNNVNITNFDTALLAAEYMLDNMTLEQRELHINSVNPLSPEEYRNNISINNPICRDFNRQIRQMMDLWTTMSYDEQTIYRMRPENVLPHSSRQNELFSVYNYSDIFSPYICNILNINIIPNFARVLSILNNTYYHWTHEERVLYASSVNPNNSNEFRNEINSRTPIFSDYNKLMREALGYWGAMSFAEQQNIRSGFHIDGGFMNMLDNVVWGGPIDRIIVFRPPTHPAEIYDVL